MSRRSYHAPEPKAVSRALARQRAGGVGRLRETARCLLLEIMGHDCREVRQGQVPSWYPRKLPREEEIEKMLVARDALLELGYDAAADDLEDGSQNARSAQWYAKEALAILEAGPPSVRLGTGLGAYTVFKNSLRAFVQSPPSDAWFPRLILVGKEARGGSSPWVQFGIFEDYSPSMQPRPIIFGDTSRLRGGKLIIQKRTDHRSLKEARGYYGHWDGADAVPSREVPVKTFFEALEPSPSQRDRRRARRRKRR